jgi:hypothetical protein
MTLITRVRFELPVGFDARILIALCCEDIVWEQSRVLSGSIGGGQANAQLGGVLGETCFYGSFSRHDGESPSQMIEAVRRRLEWLCESQLCRGEAGSQVEYRLAA